MASISLVAPEPRRSLLHCKHNCTDIIYNLFRKLFCRALEIGRKSGVRTGRLVELYYLRAVCQQAVGRYAAAHRDFRECQGISEEEALQGGGEEARGWRNAAFYMEYTLNCMFDR